MLNVKASYVYSCDSFVHSIYWVLYKIQVLLLEYRTCSNVCFEVWMWFLCCVFPWMLFLFRPISSRFTGKVFCWRFSLTLSFIRAALLEFLYFTAYYSGLLENILENFLYPAFMQIIKLCVIQGIQQSKVWSTYDLVTCLELQFIGLLTPFSFWRNN